jgi:hypothetical protein
MGTGQKQTKSMRISLFVGLLVVAFTLVIASIVVTRQWASYKESQVALLDNILHNYAQWQATDPMSKDREALVEFIDHRADLESLKGSRVKYVRISATKLLGDIAFYQEDYASAQAYYEVVSRARNHFLAGVSALNVAQMVALLEGSEAAQRQYELVATRFTGAVRYEALLNSALLLEKTDSARAKRIYAEIVADLKDDSVWRMIAQNRMVSLV